jgi:putative membrane protein
MKPYLYGLSALMVFWAAVNGRNLFRPKYKSRLKRCLVLVIPILLLAVPPAPPAAGAMVKSFSSTNINSPSGGGYQSQVGETAQAGDDYAFYGQEELEKPDEETEGGQNLPIQQQEIQDQTPSFEIKGLNEETKTITIADEDFSTWVNEINMNPQKYDGYTVIIKGFVFLNMEDRKDNEFALVRLSMWCCSADLSPMGLITEFTGNLSFQENDWVTVTGKLMMKDGYPTIEAVNMEAAQKPGEEYVYPYY